MGTMNKRLLYIQATVVLAGVVIAFTQMGSASALAAAFGGGVALLNSELLVWRVKRADDAAKTDPKRSVYILFFGAVERFVFALAGLAIGLGVLKLDPIPLLAMFGIAQVAYFFYGQSKCH